jgi:hypothetical protein
MLTAALRPPRFCVPVHERHKASLWTSQRRRWRPLVRRIRHCTAFLRRICSLARQRRGNSNILGFNDRPAARRATDSQHHSPHLLRHIGRESSTYIPALCSKRSNPSMIGCTPAPKQQRGWSQSVSCGQAYIRIAETMHGLARPASALKSSATPLLVGDFTMLAASFFTAYFVMWAYEEPHSSFVHPNEKKRALNEC